MPPVLNCQSITRHLGSRVLFEDISLTIEEGDRLGLIGPNGTGKSTLLRILAGVEEPDAGNRVVTQGTRVAWVPQVDDLPASATVEDVLVDALRELPLEPYEKITRAAIALGRTGFDDTQVRVQGLSGGWRKRLSIARALVVEPTLLLLDEPTNHLDLEGIYWLEELLRTAPFACVIVTHDRYFLENATNRVVELNRRFPGGYFNAAGSYSTFLEKREEFLAGQAQREETLANQVRNELEWLRRGAKARTRKAQARIDEAGRLMSELAEVRDRNRQSSAGIDFAATGRKTKDLVIVDGVSKSYGEQKLFSDLSFTLSPGRCLGILGANGSGKSTLLRVLTGGLDPDEGSVRHAPHLKITYFDQHRETLDPTVSLRKTLAPHSDSVVYNGETVHVASWARRFLFQSDQLETKVGDLSGGEQARVILARFLLEPADVLVLDEPTNDLDIATLELLEESIESFSGAVILVSHDRLMLDRVASILLGLDGRGGASFYADVEQWKSALQRLMQEEAQEKRAEKSADKPATESPTPQKPKKLSYKEQREWDAMETRILEAEENLVHWKSELENPAHAADPQKLQECLAEVNAAQAEVDALYARWAELEAKIA